LKLNQFFYFILFYFNLLLSNFNKIGITQFKILLFYIIFLLKKKKKKKLYFKLLKMRK